MKKYKVTLEMSACVTVEKSIEASSKEEADDIAEDMRNTYEIEEFINDSFDPCVSAFVLEVE